MDQVPSSTNQRGSFGSNIGFLLSAIGSAVGLGNIWGSIIATVILYILPEALRGFSNYRMLIYAIVLIVVMLTTNNPILKNYFASLRSRFGKNGEKEASAS